MPRRASRETPALARGREEDQKRDRRGASRRRGKTLGSFKDAMINNVSLDCCQEAAGGVLVPQPGIKPKSPALEAWSLNCWTTEEVPVCAIFDFSYWRPLESSGSLQM